jgi:hypothetical protein
MVITLNLTDRLAMVFSHSLRYKTDAEEEKDKEETNRKKRRNKEKPIANLDED